MKGLFRDGFESLLGRVDLRTRRFKTIGVAIGRVHDGTHVDRRDEQSNEQNAGQPIAPVALWCNIFIEISQGGSCHKS
jgi:hypothetical protein